MPKVSVIVPNYNHAKFLQQRLDSIFGQTYQDFEVILLDDCSTDNSREIIDQYRNHPKVSTVILNELNSGSSFKQWEKGIKDAKGDLIWIAESDDYCESNFLEYLISKIFKYPESGIAYCQSVSVNESNNRLWSWVKHTEVFQPNIWDKDFVISGSDAIKNFLLFRNVIPNASGVIFRKSVYEKTTGFETKMKLNGDWIFWVKMLEKSDLVFIADELNYFRQHQNKATETNTNNYNNIKELCDLYRYMRNHIEILKGQTNAMTLTVIRMISYQLLKKNIILTIKGLPKIIIPLFYLNPFFLFYFVPVFFEFLNYVIFKKLPTKKKHSVILK